MALTVAGMQGEKAPEQTQFEGLDVVGLAFVLKGAGGARPARHEMSQGDVVSGTWKGHVIGIHHDGETGGVNRLHVIEIDDGGIGLD